MKEILLQGGPLNRCTLYRTEREEEYKQEKQVLFCPLPVTSPIPPTRGSPTCGDCQHDSLCHQPFAWSSSFFGKVTTEPTECLCLGDLTWKALIQLSFSTWSQIFETENSRPGTIRGKLGVFSHCPPLSFEDSTSWPIPGKSLKPYVSEEDFLEGSSQQMTVPRL